MKEKNKKNAFLFFAISAFAFFLISIGIAVKSFAGNGTDWTTPCGFGNNRGTSYLSSPCSSSYNCCMEAPSPKPVNVVEHSVPKKQVPKKHVSTYDISLHDIYFAFNSAALTDRDRAILKRDAEYLKNNPNIVVQIQGNCDQRGSVSYNMALASRRINSAKNYLENLGITSDRLKTVVFGKSNLPCKANNASCYAMNRRDHFEVISK
jgi:peptidoglycan-associated lipoprotein